MTVADEVVTEERIPLRPPRTVSNPLSLTRLDRAVARSAAGFGLAFFLQSVPAPFLLAQIGDLRPAWSIPAVGGLAASLLFTLVASVAARYVRIAHATFAIVYVIALATWPFSVIAPPKNEQSFFLYFILSIATVMATIGFGPKVATLYTLGVPALYALVRLTPAGGGVGVVKATLDSTYSVLLGALISITIYVLRAAARNVDQAQQTALARYSHAVRQHAIEAERVQVDAIVHDSVLTTLLSAARAESPEAKKLAGTMAGNAIGHLRNAAAVGPDVEGEVEAAVIAGRIADAAGTMAAHFATRIDDPGRASVPIAAAEALYSAAVQAMVNSFQHAGGDVPRWVAVRALGEEGVEVEVGDRGTGFAVEAVPIERLGVRVSILERVSTAGGRADIRSGAEGTVVTLRWEPATAVVPSVAPDVETAL